MKQKIVYGIGNLEEVVAALHCRKVLLVVDTSFPYLNIRRQVLSVKVPFLLFDQFGSNPLYEDVCKGVELFRSRHCDAIVAVGGGSCIDVAKCIKLYCRMNPEENYLQQEAFDSGVPLVAFPTTAGTGSESTRYAVIYYEGKKQSVSHDSIVPDYAVLEPKVLATLPTYQKKCTVMDALCQAIESWWSVNSTEESKTFSRKAVETLRDNIQPYLFGNTDDNILSAVFERVMTAANHAGQAINITQTTAPHAFSYKLTSMYGLPHGHAVAVCLPYIWEYMLQHPERCVDTRGEVYLSSVFSEIAASLRYSTAMGAVGYLRGLLDEMQLFYPVAKERERELSVLTTSVNPVRLKNNPVRLDEEAIVTLYKSILK